jgi:hypothetical protein
LKTKNLAPFHPPGRWRRPGAGLARGFLLAGLAIAGPACTSSPAGYAPAADERLKPVYDAATRRLSELQYDSNQDGRPDVRAFMEGTRLLRAEIDENADGRPDRWEFYAEGARLQALGPSVDPSGGRSPLPIERVEISSRRDGAINRREFYERGVLARVEEDANGDGRTDRWETYAEGVMTTMALDLGHRGTPDRRFVYAPDGTVLRTEADPDGDGAFETVTPGQPPSTVTSAKPVVR